jgi:hypothetical protein
VRVTRSGKQLLLDGEHLADCRSDQAASWIASVLNRIWEESARVIAKENNGPKEQAQG